MTSGGLREPAMSAPGSIHASEALATDWLVRPAGEADAQDAAAAVRALLLELGATPAPLERLVAAAQALIVEPEAGSVFLAQASDGGVIGMLSASLQQAIHIPGRYAIVQDLWVEPAWRGQLIGAGLVDALLRAMRARGVFVVEVGLPKARFRGLEATESFYLANGFTLVGSRMRWVAS
jgi:GNAT superfamily N-acetyltransferase